MTLSEFKDAVRKRLPEWRQGTWELFLVPAGRQVRARHASGPRVANSWLAERTPEGAQHVATRTAAFFAEVRAGKVR
jgi:hypothetical protein